MTKIGVFGGTFNPVHNGHVYAAKKFREECGLQTVFVIPNNEPHLNKSESADANDRLQMLRLAFENEQGFVISDMEIRRGGISYSCDTVAELRREYPDAEIYLYCGDDWLDRITQWKNFEWLKEHVIFAVAGRNGQIPGKPQKAPAEETGMRVIRLRFEAIPASSTAIRNGDMTCCCEKVRAYILERGLYGIRGCDGKNQK